MRLPHLLLGLIPIAALLACATAADRDRGELRFSEPPAPHAGEPFPNWPVPPLRAEELLGHGIAEVLSLENAGGGTTGALRMRVRFPKTGDEFSVKWKRMPRRLDGFNNSPRKELAAYQLQRIFLSPEDYVVPTAVARCALLEQLRTRDPGVKPTLPGTQCVLGVVAIWMRDVTVPDRLYDESRFRRDATYAYFMSNLNLLTYLIQHKDGRSGNFLVSKDEARRRAFAIDNGISFGPWVYNYFVPNWNDLRVAGLRKESMDRLRQVHREDLEFLAVVAQLEADEQGILRLVEPGPPLDPGDGVRVEGTTVQLGLEDGEIEDVYQRIQELIEEVDEGGIPVF